MRKLNNSLVSIVMPCYNRAEFLKESLEAIQSQTYTHWEIILVDDGSSDNTKAVLADLMTPLLEARLRYIFRDNGGAYAARNTGIDDANGAYIAMYDSDDLWLPHHLQDCVQALEDHPEVSWVYADAKKVNYETGELVVPSGFRESGLHPMFDLPMTQHGSLHIFDDIEATICCEFENNLCCFLQTGVIRKEVFEGRRFSCEYRSEGEDEIFPARAMKAGFRLGFIDNIHLEYRFHQNNASSAAIGISINKHLNVLERALSAYYALPAEMELTQRELAALNARIANDHFWKRGYVLLWGNGRAQEAFGEFKKGIAAQPYNLKLRKTFWLCKFKQFIGAVPNGSTP